MGILLSKIEKGRGIHSGIKELRFNASNIAMGITGFVFGISGIVLIFSSVGIEAGLSQEQIISWMFIGFGLGGILSIAFSLHYRMPIVLSCSMGALAVVGVQYRQFTIPVMCGAFIMTGIVIFLAGLSGIMGSIRRILPVPIVMGMIAGIFMNYAFKMIYAVQAEPLVCFVILLSYFLALRFAPKNIPPQLVALVISVCMVVLFLPPKIPEEGLRLSLGRPVFVVPQFTFASFISVSLPLTFMVLTDVIKAYGIMKVQNYNPPLNAIVAISGLASIIGGFAVSHVMSFADAGTAIVVTSAGGPHEHRYAASVLKNCFSLLIAITLGLSYPLLSVLPVTISNILAGLAMLSIFTSSLESAFKSGEFRIGTFTAMIIGITNVSIGNVSAPIVAIGCGILVSLLAEWNDFKKLLSIEPSLGKISGDFN
jgi:benzoate membrane transport protein